MKIYTIILALFLFIDCSSFTSSEKNTSVSNNNLQTSTSNHIKPTETPHQTNSNSTSQNTISSNQTSNSTGNSVKDVQSDKDEFSLQIVNDPQRNAQNVHIVIDGKPKWIIETPSFEDVNNFAVDEAKMNKNGFEIQVEYGTRYKYEKTFIFIQKDNSFYFTQIKVTSFDGNNPEKFTEKTIAIKPQVSLNEFKMDKYLTD